MTGVLSHGADAQGMALSQLTQANSPHGGNTPLAQSVSAVFAQDGLLAQQDSHYQPRPGQQQMAQLVAACIDNQGQLVVEAGTGVGKTYAYLVPALLSGKRVVLSTATKNLQDQLFHRDIPRLRDMLGMPLTVRLLKGRGNYLCWHRMEHAHFEVKERHLLQALTKVRQWAQATSTGDLAQMPGLDERSSLRPFITSTRENCLGSECPRFRDCHVQLARKEALAADVVVINHHLFFADLAVRESGMAEILPSSHVVIFDEAHQLNEVGVQFLGKTLGTGQVLDFVRDVLAQGLQHARGLANWQELCGDLERAVRDFRMTAGKQSVGSRLNWLDAAPEGIHPEYWTDQLQAVSAQLVLLQQALALVVELSPDFAKLFERCQQIDAMVRLFLAPKEPTTVRWLEVGMQLRLVQSPLDIADAVQSKLLDAPEQVGKAWVFTSATLGSDPQLTWFTESCGLQAATIARVDSPFDYPAQAALYVPPHLPAPNTGAAHGQALAAWVAKAVRRLQGRTLVLTTTLRALQVIGDALQAALLPQDGIDVLVQGQASKAQLLSRFRGEGNLHDEPRDAQSGARRNEFGSTPRGSVLVASSSFWEGVDLPGDQLQLVVIDKLPFPPPGDPLVQARSDRLQSQGRSPFRDHALPEAIVALKQGAGRLIRTEDDRGILVIGDVRLAQTSYGRQMLQALPPMRRLANEAAFEAAVGDLVESNR